MWVGEGGERGEVKSLLYSCLWYIIILCSCMRVCVCMMILSLFQDDHSIPLSCTIFVGPNCDVEYQNENGEVGSF